MNPFITNFLIRLFLDEFIPPLIRDLKIFMYPLYFLWFKGDKNNINIAMNFKKNVFAMNSEDIRLCYKRYHNLGSTRGTDAFVEDYKWVLARIDKRSKTLLDVGCGNGFWLDHIAKNTDPSQLKLFGLDIIESLSLGANMGYTCGEIETLPFADKSFDIVTCFFVLEHIKNLNQAIKELKRITRHQLFLAVPCQRYYKYTFDLHVHFFYSPEYFQSIVAASNSESALIGYRNTGHILFYGEMAE